jgi:hypothetical protein
MSAHGRKGIAMYVLNDPQYWRAQAKEMTALASGMKDKLTRHAMRKIASDYEQLALRADERLARFTHSHERRRNVR